MTFHDYLRAMKTGSPLGVHRLRRRGRPAPAVCELGNNWFPVFLFFARTDSLERIALDWNREAIQQRVNPLARRQGATMIAIRPYQDLGGGQHGWFDTRHHFSFADYHDPARMGWGRLRVWNDDQIAPKSGFPPHPHADMEIISYVREGAITHQDRLGDQDRTEAGDLQADE